MSSIIFQDVNTIEYTSIKFDYLAIDTDDILEQQENERLLVHQNGSNFSMIVLDTGLFLNTTRENAKAQEANHYALYADGNAYFTGSLTARTINILDTEISDSNITKLIDTINSNTGPFEAYNDPLYEEHLNYFTHNNINILDNSHSEQVRCNLHPLALNRSALYSAYNAQLAIGNNANDGKNNQSELLIGIFGSDYKSPATIITNPGKSLEFYISTQNCNINNLYNNAVDFPNYTTIPTLQIDTSNSVNINSSNAKVLIYETNEEITKLNVEGYGYIKELFVYDHTANKPSHLDDIYFKKGDKYFNTSNIKSGIFEGNFGFNSNLIVNCNIDTSNLSSKIATINKIITDEIDVKNIKIGITDHFYKNDEQLDIKRIDVKTILYSNHTIQSNLLEASFYNEVEIKDYIESNLSNNGLIRHITGISDSTRIELINDTSNALYTIDTIEYYNNVEVESNLYYKFINRGSNIDLNHPVIENCNVNVFTNLSNNFIDTAELCNITEITSNIYDILYYEGSNDTLQYYIKDSSNLKIDYEKLSNLLYDIATLDEDCNITSNIISNINISGFCNLYIEQYYRDDTGDLTSIYPDISNNEININDKYRIHLSNTVDDNDYTAEEIINSIYENGLNPYQYTYDLESNFKLYLKLEIVESNEILDIYSNTLITEGFNNITTDYIKNFDTFKNTLNSALINLKDSIPSSNLLSFNTCVNKIEDHIDTNGHSRLTSNLVYILDQFEYKNITRDQAVNRQLLNFVTNYDTSNIENDSRILIYSVNDGLVNTNNNDVSIPNGLFSIGTDTTNGAMLSIRNNNSNNPEIVISEEDYEVQIGHNITNKETFTIKTNNIQDHNIELNAGAYGPNLFLKANTTNVGINTRNPTKALDVNGDIISTNYYKRYLGEPKLIANFLDYKDHIKLEKKKRLLIESPVKITNKLTINKIFKGDNELFNFNKKTYNNQHYLHSEVGCIFMGEDVNENIDNTAMLLQNNLNIEKNNTIIRLLKATKWSQGNNPDPYTGIEFTRYPNDPYTGWYIHNKHDHDSFEIGYRNNENNAFNLIKTSYSYGTDGINDIEIGDGNGDNKIILNNNVEVKGDIDVIGGTYRLNGAVFSSNNIDLSTILANASVLNDPSFPNIVQPNDISMSSASRIINLIARGSSMFIGTYDSNNYDENNPVDEPGFTNYLQGYSIQHKQHSASSGTTQFDANVNIVMPVDNSIVNYNQPPLLALKATYNLNNFGDNKNVKSGIRLAILNSGTTPDYWDNKNYADLYYKYFNNKGEFGIDFKYKNGDKNTPFKITEKNDEIYTTLSSVNNTDNSNAFFHILDDNKDSLLLLETTQHQNPINIKLKTQNNEWNIDTDANFKITHNDKHLTFNDNGLGINVKDPLASLDISNSNIYGITIKNNITTNNNTKKYYIDTDQIIDQEPITYTNSITFNLNETITNHTTSNIETNSNISITQIFYNCNFTGNDDINSKLEYSNIYDVSIDNHTNESNFTLNININLALLNDYLSSKYSILTGVNLASNIYEASNDEYPGAIVKVATIYDLNNLIISNISTSNYEIYLNGVDESPELLSNYTICNIDFAVYHPENCNYDFTADVNLAIDYTITTNIISGIHSALEIKLQDSDVYEINFINEECRSNVPLNEIIDLTYTCNIDGIDHTYDFNPITLKYYTIDKTCNVPIDIIEPQAHIKLTTDQDTKSYYITGHNSNFNINYQDDTILKEILNITNKGELTIDTLNVKNILCTGILEDYESLIFCNEDFNSINITNNHLYINTESAYSILINTDDFDDKNTYTSVIFGNKVNQGYSNIIALQSSSTNSYLNITTNGQSDNYKIGKTDNNFNIIHTDSNILSIKPEYDEFNYSNFDFDADSDNDDDEDGLTTANELTTSTIKTITTEYDYIFTEGRLKGIKNINYTSNLIFTEQTTPIMSMNQDDITMHQRLICALGTTTSSDRRIKDNINIIENALDKIDRLDGVSYFNKLSKSNEIGLIAQDVKEVIPEVVVDSDIMGIQYGNMIGLLIEGIKELRKEIRNGSNSKC
jgi:hypothetical protein